VILRVFPERTRFTPADPFVAIGAPGLFTPRGISEVHISAPFTWQTDEAFRLAAAWRDHLPGIPVKAGGPAFDDPGGPFVPGRYLASGISISSRGCPEKCPWCYVPRREGGLRLLDLCEGYIVQDNNVLAWPRDRFEALCRMLGRQKRGAEFKGGFQAGRLKPWHVDAIRGIQVEEIWLAADYPGALDGLRNAIALLRPLPRYKLMAYVLVGFGDETIDEATARLEAVWDAGAMPFAQIYRDDSGAARSDRAWRDLVRVWSRPALIKAAHR
jgi:hypothetical protein